MPLPALTNTLLDDRGHEVVARNVSELLGDVRVEAGKGRFSWSTFATISVMPFVALFFIARALHRVFNKGGGSLALAVIITVSVVIGVIAFVVHLKREAKQKRGIGSVSDRARFVASALVSCRRYGACGYGLMDATAEPDGCAVCSECGAAWHASRFSAEAVDPAGASARVEAAIKTQSSDGQTPFDDRSIPITLVTHKGRSNGEPPASTLGAGALDLLHEEAVKWRTILWTGVALGAILIISGVLLWDGRAVLGSIVTGLGLFAFIGAAATAAIRAEWTRRRAFFLSRCICPSCLAELNGPPSFDNCVVCATCNAAWNAERLGAPDVLLKEGSTP